MHTPYHPERTHQLRDTGRAASKQEDVVDMGNLVHVCFCGTRCCGLPESCRRCDRLSRQTPVRLTEAALKTCVLYTRDLSYLRMAIIGVCMLQALNRQSCGVACCTGERLQILQAGQRVSCCRSLVRMVFFSETCCGLIDRHAERR